MIIAALGSSVLPLPPHLPYFFPFPAFSFTSLTFPLSLSPVRRLLFSLFTLFPSLVPPIPLSGLSLYSLIAHNHSQSVSVTNRPIRVGSRPYGRQAASVMVSSICFLPSTHASESRLCDLKGMCSSVGSSSATFQGSTGAVDSWSEAWGDLCCCKNHLLLCVDETKTTGVQRYTPGSTC